MLFKYIVPALAAANGVYAACSVSATTTVSDAAGATALAACATFTGSIAMASNSAGQMTFDGITIITGDLVGYGTNNITGVSAATLQSIGGALGLSSMTAVSSLNFPDLTSVGTLNWTALGPNLQTLTFTKGITTVGTLNIADTYIQSLTGINPTTATAVSLGQNLYLTTIDLPLKTVTGALSITANANGASMVTLSELEMAGSLTVNNVTSLMLPALNNVTNLFSLAGNKFTSMSLPNFTTSTGFAIDNNDEMTNFTVPAYTVSSGGVSVQNNTALVGTVSFPVLTRVNGAVEVLGAFDAVSMPKLNSVLGGMTLISTQVIADTCSHFNALQGSSNVIQGVETCSPSASSAATTSSSGTTSSSTSSSSSSSTSKSGSMFNAPSEASAYTVFGLLAAFFGLLM